MDYIDKEEHLRKYGHNGASHIPLIEHDGKLCVILFSEPYYNINMDSGGHAEYGESPAETASREGKEESLNTFNIEDSELVYYINYYNVSNMIVFKNYYAFFVKYVMEYEEIKKVYENNKNIIWNQENVPEHWKESDNINLFPIESFLEGKQTERPKYYICKDAFGEDKIVYYRPINYIINAINKGIIYKKNNIWFETMIPLKNTVIKENITDDFLNKTLSIKIHK